ncbi:MAG: FHA domain-containing protein, partial [Planctomycetes bacterium]|nr:FHA domain-containing protein [Planctomycetota bacterium]
MASPSPLLYCTSCGRQIGIQARCPECGAENEFIDVPAPAVSFRFDEDHLWSPEAVLDALNSQGAAPPPPPQRGAGSQPAGSPEAGGGAAADAGGEASLFFDFPAGPGAKPQPKPGAGPRAMRPAEPRPPHPGAPGAQPGSGDGAARGGGAAGETSAKAAASGAADPSHAPSLFFDFPADGPASAPGEGRPAPPRPGGASAAEPKGGGAAPPPAPPSAPGGEATFILPAADAEPAVPEQTFILQEPEAPPVVATLVRLSPPGQGTIFAIRPGTTSIGTQGTDIVLDRKVDRAVSRRHADIECQALEGSYRFELIDRESSNGTFIGGRRVKGSAPLESQAVIRLGNV